jgi:glutathione peroxidase
MSLYDIAVTTIDGQSQTLANYRNRVLLIVNVASQCSFTRQYTGLESLHREFKDRGFAVLGFPCNQFGHQEPGNESEIKSFCSLNYNVSFPMFAKVAVNGPKTHPLYQFLKSEKPGVLASKPIKWNFTKFLVDQRGNVVGRYGPLSSPTRIGRHVQKLVHCH